MSTATATARMTADEFLEFVNRPENEGRWFELVRGEVIELSPPTKKHGVVSFNVIVVRRDEFVFGVINAWGPVVRRWWLSTCRRPFVACLSGTDSSHRTSYTSYSTTRPHRSLAQIT